MPVVRGVLPAILCKVQVASVSATEVVFRMVKTSGWKWAKGATFTVQMSKEKLGTFRKGDTFFVNFDRIGEQNG